MSDTGGDVAADRLEKNAGFDPEIEREFRAARLLLLFDVAEHDSRKLASIDRIAIYEFFSDNPWMIIEGERPLDRRDRLAIEVAGFAIDQLAYSSVSFRYLSRRELIRDDMGFLLVRGLILVQHDQYRISSRGMMIAAQMHSSYAQAYRTSAGIVVRRLASRSNNALEKDVERWLGKSWLLLDLLEDVKDPLAGLLMSYPIPRVVN